MIPVIKTIAWRVEFCLLLIFVLVVMGGCVSTKGSIAPAQRLVWPSPPLEEKIEWVAEYKPSILQRANGGFWQSVKKIIFGEHKEEMTRPYGVCTDGDTKLFVADTGAAVIHVYDMETFQYQVIEGSRQYPFISPIGVAYSAGAIYITDSAQAKVFRYELATEKMSLWAYVNLERPTGIVISDDGQSFYIVDTQAHQVITYDRNGAEQMRFGSRGIAPGQFNFPTDIAIGPEGKIFVTDSLNARVQVFTRDGQFLSTFGQAGDTPGNFSKPKGIGVDRRGHVFICDALFDAVQIFNSDGKLLLTFGDNGARNGQFWMPSGLHIDKKRNVFVTDTYNRRIQQFRIMYK